MNALAEEQRRRERSEYPIDRKVIRQRGSATSAPRLTRKSLQHSRVTMGDAEQVHAAGLSHIQDDRVMWTLFLDNAIRTVARAKIMEADFARFTEDYRRTVWYRATSYPTDVFGSVGDRHFLRHVYDLSEHSEDTVATYAAGRSWGQPPAEPMESAPTLPAKTLYGERLSVLEASAEEDDITVVPESASEFLSFVDQYPHRGLKRAHLFLLGDGTICAEWVGETREVSLQFGGRHVQIAVLNVDKDVPETESLSTVDNREDCYAMLAEVRSILEE